LASSIELHYRSYSVASHVAMWAAAGLEGMQVKPMSVGGGLVMSELSD
jgi:hypothetical protein